MTITDTLEVTRQWLFQDTETIRGSIPVEVNDIFSIYYASTFRDYTLYCAFCPFMRDKYRTVREAAVAGMFHYHQKHDSIKGLL